MNVPFFRPTVEAEEKSAVQQVLDSGWLTTGKVTRQFEEEFARYVGAPHAVAVNSCTAALHLALEAAGTKPDDIVFVPAMTFAATAEVVRYFGARPVLVDCDEVTMCVDPRAMALAVEAWALRGKLRAMLPVHYGGQMAAMEPLHRIARAHGMHVIEDAAHCLPAYYRRSDAEAWQPAGRTSSLTCFSFYANKCITTGEGGMAVTDDEQLAERMRVMSLHGLSKSAWNRFESKGSWYYEIVAPGFKYNLTDIASALGRAQLAKAGRLWRERCVLARRYAGRLAALAEFVETPVELENRQSSWHLYPIRLHLQNLAIDRAQFIDEMKQRGVVCSVHWMPLHRHPYYRELYGYREGDMPVADSLWPRLVSLPLFPGMTDAEFEHVLDSVTAICRAHSRRCFAMAVRA
jgi:perosamine synthetase